MYMKSGFPIDVMIDEAYTACLPFETPAHQNVAPSHEPQTQAPQGERLFFSEKVFGFSSSLKFKAVRPVLLVSKRNSRRDCLNLLADPLVICTLYRAGRGRDEEGLRSVAVFCDAVGLENEGDVATEDALLPVGAACTVIFAGWRAACRRYGQEGGEEQGSHNSLQ